MHTAARLLSESCARLDSVTLRPLIEAIRNSGSEAPSEYGPDLIHQIVEFAGHINAANYRFLMLVAEWDRRKGWNDGASQSCAHWLNWKCGIDMGRGARKGARGTAEHVERVVRDYRCCKEAEELSREAQQ